MGFPAGVAIVVALLIYFAFYFSSSGVNKKLLEEVLSDNPAGNEDQQTPIVIVRNLKE
jgi:hypothetical protein